MRVERAVDAAILRDEAKAVNGRSIKSGLLCISLMVLGGGMSANSSGDVGDFAKEMAARALEPWHANWKETVLLQDGRTLIVERS